MSIIDETLKEMLGTLEPGDEEATLALLAKIDGLIQKAGCYAPKNWSDDLVQDVRIKVYEWLQQITRNDRDDE